MPSFAESLEATLHNALKMRLSARMNMQRWSICCWR